MNWKFGGCWNGGVEGMIVAIPALQGNLVDAKSTQEVISGQIHCLTSITLRDYVLNLLSGLPKRWYDKLPIY